MSGISIGMKATPLRAGCTAATVSSIRLSLVGGATPQDQVDAVARCQVMSSMAVSTNVKYPLHWRNVVAR